MAKADGYGMKAKEVRSPSSMPPTKSDPDSAKPGSQYNQLTAPAKMGDRNKASGDSGRPTSNRNGGSNPANSKSGKKSSSDSGNRDF